MPRRERLRSVSMFGPAPEISLNGEAVDEADSRLRPPASTERQLSVPTAVESSQKRRRVSEYSMTRKKSSSPVSVRKLSAMFSGKSEEEAAEVMREMAPRQSAGRGEKGNFVSVYRWQSLRVGGFVELFLFDGIC